MSTLRFVCSKPDCTVAATGKCLELHDPAECPHATIAGPSSGAGKPPTEEASARRFPPATELGLSDALAVTHGGYAHLIAILGATNAGKTCMLNALYLLASHAGLLPRFRFAGSLTLAGFELRTRRLRKWEMGTLPKKLAEHTIRPDTRNPGLLHLALSDAQHDNRRIELLLTDLPGEWTTRLIEQSGAAERFEFLQRADSLLIAVDGPKLHDTNHKHRELLNLRQLIDRLADAVDLHRATPMFIVICKGDESGLSVPQGVDEIVEHSESKGFRTEALVVASFSRNPTRVPNGYGILGLVEATIDHESPISAPIAVRTEPPRSFGRSLRLVCEWSGHGKAT